jgi:hypothetical protein
MPTDITISSISIPSWRWGGATAKLRIYNPQGFTASDGTPVQAGSPGSRKWYQEVDCTVTGSVVTCPSFVIKSTTDALDNQNTRYVAVLVDGNGVERDTFPSTLASGFYVPPTFTPTTWPQIVLANRATRPWRDTTTYTKDQINNLLSTLPPAQKGSDSIFGVLRTRTPPLDSANPTVIEQDDPKVNAEYYAQVFSSFAAAVSAVGSTEATLVVDTSQSVTASVTIPLTLTLRFTNAGMLNVSSGQKVTIKSSAAGYPLKQIFTGAGTVVFGNESNPPAQALVPAIYPHWWGAKGDGATDDRAAINAAIVAASACAGRVRLVGIHRVSGPITALPNITLDGGEGVSTNWARLLADASLGFSGNHLLFSDPTTFTPSAANMYSTIQNLAFDVRNVNNASFEAVHIANWSETANVKNLSFNVVNSTLSRLLYFNNFGPAIIENVNLYYPTGAVTVNNEPLYLRALNGLIVRGLNYTANSPKAPYFEASLYMLLEGLQIETHPTVAAEPSVDIYGGTGGVTFRDSNILTDVDDSTGVRIQTNVLPDLGAYLIENVAAQRHYGVGTGSFDKLVVIRDGGGTEKAWDAALLNTTATAQRASMIHRFSPKEQVFGGVEVNDSARQLQSLFLFKSIANNGTVTIPFDNKVYVGANGAGDVLIRIVGRDSGTNLPNRALIYMSYADNGTLQTQFEYLLGSSGTNWAVSYSTGPDRIVLTNKFANSMSHVIVSVSHNTWNLWPRP